MTNDPRAQNDMGCACCPHGVPLESFGPCSVCDAERIEELTVKLEAQAADHQELLAHSLKIERFWAASRAENAALAKLVDDLIARMDRAWTFLNHEDGGDWAVLDTRKAKALRAGQQKEPT